MLNRNKFKFKIYLWVAGLILAVFFTLPVYASDFAPQGASSDKSSIALALEDKSEITPAKILELTNQSRDSEGLLALALSSQLTEAAQLKAQDMFSHGYFAHTSPEGVDPWYWIKKAGYPYEYAGENLAMDFLSSEATHQALINSATHRKNILNSLYKEIGIAVVSGEFKGSATIITVEMFGSRIVPSAIADEAIDEAAAVSDSAPKSEEAEKFAETSLVLSSAEKDFYSEEVDGLNLPTGQAGNTPAVSQEPEPDCRQASPALNQEPTPPDLSSEDMYPRLQEPSMPEAGEIILVSLIKPDFAYSGGFLDSSLENGFLIKLDEEGMSACRQARPEKNGIVKGHSGWDQNSKNFIGINFLKNFNQSNLAFTFLFLYLWMGFCTVFEGIIREF